MMPSAAAVLMTFSLVILRSSELRNTEVSFLSCGSGWGFFFFVFFGVFLAMLYSSAALPRFVLEPGLENLPGLRILQLLEHHVENPHHLLAPAVVRHAAEDAALRALVVDGQDAAERAVRALEAHRLGVHARGQLARPHRGMVQQVRERGPAGRADAEELVALVGEQAALLAGVDDAVVVVGQARDAVGVGEAPMAALEYADHENQGHLL